MLGIDKDERNHCEPRHSERLGLDCLKSAILTGSYLVPANPVPASCREEKKRREKNIIFYLCERTGGSYSATGGHLNQPRMSPDLPK